MGDHVESTVRIPSSFSVENTPDLKRNLAWRDSAVKIVCLQLTAATKEYAVMKDSGEFKVV